MKNLRPLVLGSTLLCSVCVSSLNVQAQSTTTLICGLCAPALNVQAQPTTAPRVVNEVKVSLDKKGFLRLSAKFENVEMNSIADAIAGAGNLSLVKGSLKGPLKRFSFVEERPQDALRLFCEAANLNCFEREGMWVIGSRPTKPQCKHQRIEFSIRDVNVRQLLEMIAEQFELKIWIDERISETQNLASLDLSNLSGEQALERIAAAADLQLTRENDIFFVKPQPKTAP